MNRHYLIGQSGERTPRTNPLTTHLTLVGTRSSGFPCLLEVRDAVERVPTVSGRFMGRVLMLLVLLWVGLKLAAPAGAAPQLDRDFKQPPASARPWVYWFWLNGNITSNGITADLEAMKRVGIGGVLIMEVDQGAPVGPVDFMGRQWRELVQACGRGGAAARAGSEHEQRRGLERQRRALDQARAIHAEGRLERDQPDRPEAL